MVDGNNPSRPEEWMDHNTHNGTMIGNNDLISRFVMMDILWGAPVFPYKYSTAQFESNPTTYFYEQQ